MHVFTLLSASQITSADLRPGPWLSVMAFGLMIVGGILLWHFAKMAKVARQPWPGDDAADESSAESDRSGG